MKVHARLSDYGKPLVFGCGIKTTANWNHVGASGTKPDYLKVLWEGVTCKPCLAKNPRRSKAKR